MIYPLRILMLTFVVSSCSLQDDTSEEEICEFIIPDNTIRYNNFFFVNSKLSREMGLPETSFFIQYPNNVEASCPMNNADYFTIRKTERNDVIEEINIGSSTLTLKNRDEGVVLLKKLINRMVEQFPIIEVKRITEDYFLGSKIPLFEGYMNCDSSKIPGYNGMYRIMMLMPMPKNNINLCVPIVTFMSNDQSEIRSFQDFEDEGMIGDVWSSFRYNE